MRTETERRKILDLLARHEEAVGRLYAVYAKLFPTQAEFWKQFSEEEFRHASWIRQLDLLVAKGRIGFDAGRYRTKALQTSLAFVEMQAENVQDEAITQVAALSMALSLENGLIEKGFFEVFENDSPQFSELLQKLSEATKDHRERMKLAWDEVRGGSQAA